MCLYSVYLGAVGVLLPYLGEAFSLGAEAQGRLFPANFIGFVVGVLLCGYLSDRWGRKSVLLIGLGVYALGLVLFGGARSYPLALAAALLVGAGSGAMEVVANALAADLFPERRAVLLNLLQVAFGAGAAAAPTLCRYLLTHGTDWRMLYFGLAGLNLALLAVFCFCRLPRSETQEALDLSQLQTVLQKPDFGVLVCDAGALRRGGDQLLLLASDLLRETAPRWRGLDGWRRNLILDRDDGWPLRTGSASGKALVDVALRAFCGRRRDLLGARFSPGAVPYPC